MAIDDIILHIFYLVATYLPAIPRHSPAKFYPSELVTTDILFSLKDGHFAPSIAGWNGIMTIGLVMARYSNERGVPIYGIVIGRGITAQPDPTQVAEKISKRIHEIWHE